MVKVEKPEDIRDTVESQKNIEQIILRLTKYAKEHNLKIHFFDEGNYFDSSSPLIHKDPSPIVEAFLMGIESEEDFNQYIDVCTGGLKDLAQPASQYNFWLKTKKFLLENHEGDVGKREKLLKRAEEALAKIDMDLVYIRGVFSKLISDGVVDPKGYKKCEDEAAIKECIQILYGDKKDQVGWTKTTLKKDIDIKKLLAIMETRENISADFIFKDIEENHTDLNVITYGASHKFKNNVRRFNTKTGQQIGLVRLSTISRKTEERRLKER